MRGSVVKIMSGNSSSSSSSSLSALLAMMVVMMTLFISKTDCFSMNETITISSTWCNGLNDDPSCLIGETDLDSNEFMLDSDFSRRILKETSTVTGGTTDPNNPAGCGRMPKDDPCHGKSSNGNQVNNCGQFKRDCHKYP